MKGFLRDGPAAGQVVEAGDPPVRRGVFVVAAEGFGEDAHRYYLCSVDSTGVVYTYGGPVFWPPEAGPRVVREPLADPAEVAEQMGGDSLRR
jgi:hypothetical protein